MTFHKSFYNNQKIPLIPPLLINPKFVTDIKTKAGIFHKLFAEQSTPLKNDSVLPTIQHVPTQPRLHSINSSFEEIPTIIRLLNVNKGHGNTDISIRMIMICDNSLVRPLSLKKFIWQFLFSRILEKLNIILFYKKNDNRHFENYHRISLLPIFRKVFEKITFTKMFTFRQNEQLLNPNQSGLRPSDSCINQLLSTRHDIFQSFDATPPNDWVYQRLWQSLA